MGPRCAAVQLTGGFPDARAQLQSEATDALQRRQDQAMPSQSGGRCRDQAAERRVGRRDRPALTQLFEPFSRLTKNGRVAIGEAIEKELQGRVGNPDLKEPIKENFPELQKAKPAIS